MIRLSNDRELNYVIASGGLGFDGRGYWFETLNRWRGLLKPELFTIVTKTVTYKPRLGNLRWWKRFGGCVCLIDKNGDALNEWHWLTNSPRIAGVVNAVGLTNPGYEAWCIDQWVKTRRWRYAIIASILADSPNEAEEMIYGITHLVKANFVAIEVNLSCPNTAEGQALINNADKSVAIVQAAHEAAGPLPILVKLNHRQDYLAIARAVAPYAEAISINSADWNEVFGEKPSPLRHLGVNGGVSGQVAQPILWQMARELVNLNFLPVIGPSVWKNSDIFTLTNDIGCGAVAFGALHLKGRHGSRLPTRFVEDLSR